MLRRLRDCQWQEVIPSHVLLQYNPLCPARIRQSACLWGQDSVIRSEWLLLLGDVLHDLLPLLAHEVLPTFQMALDHFLVRILHEIIAWIHRASEQVRSDVPAQLLPLLHLHLYLEPLLTDTCNFRGPHIRNYQVMASAKDNVWWGVRLFRGHSSHLLAPNKMSWC